MVRMPFPSADALVLSSEKATDEGFKDESITIELYSLRLGETFRTHSARKAMVAGAFVEHEEASRSSMAPAAETSSRSSSRSQVRTRRGEVYIALPVRRMRLKSCAT